MLLPLQAIIPIYYFDLNVLACAAKTNLNPYFSQIMDHFKLYLSGFDSSEMKEIQLQALGKFEIYPLMLKLGFLSVLLVYIQCSCKTIIISFWTHWFSFSKFLYIGTLLTRRSCSVIIHMWECTNVLKQGTRDDKQLYFSSMLFINFYLNPSINGLKLKEKGWETWSMEATLLHVFFTLLHYIFLWLSFPLLHIVFVTAIRNYSLPCWWMKQSECLTFLCKTNLIAMRNVIKSREFEKLLIL